MSREVCGPATVRLHDLGAKPNETLILNAGLPVKAQLLKFSQTLEPTFDAAINVLPPKVRPKANDAIAKVIEAAKLERSIVLLGLAAVLALVVSAFLLITGTLMFVITAGVRIMYM